MTEIERKAAALEAASRIYTGSGRYINNINTEKMKRQILDLAEAFDEFLRKE